MPKNKGVEIEYTVKVHLPPSLLGNSGVGGIQQLLSSVSGDRAPILPPQQTYQPQLPPASEPAQLMPAYEGPIYEEPVYQEPVYQVPDFTQAAIAPIEASAKKLSLSELFKKYEAVTQAVVIGSVVGVAIVAVIWKSEIIALVGSQDAIAVEAVSNDEDCPADIEGEIYCPVDEPIREIKEPAGDKPAGIAELLESKPALGQ